MNLGVDTNAGASAGVEIAETPAAKAARLEAEELARKAQANATPAPAESTPADTAKVASVDPKLVSQMGTGVPAVGLSSQAQDSVAAAQPKEVAQREAQLDPEKQVKTLMAALDERLNQNKTAVKKNLEELTNPSNPADDLAAQQAARFGNSSLAVEKNPEKTKVDTGSALRERASLLERKQKAERLLREGKTEQALSYLQSSPKEQSRDIDSGHTDRAVSAHRDAATALEAGNLEKAKLLEDLAQRAEAVGTGPVGTGSHNFNNSTPIGGSSYAAQRVRKELLSAAIGDASRATNSESIAQVRKDYESTLDGLDKALASKDTGKIKETLTSLKEEGLLTELDRLDAALAREDIGKIKDVVASLKQQSLLPKSDALDAALASKDIGKIKDTLASLQQQDRLPHTISSQIRSDWRQNIERKSPAEKLRETDLDPGPGPNPFSMGQKRNERITSALSKTEDMQSLPDATRALMATRDNSKEELSAKDKETYLLAVEAQKSGHHELAQSMVTSLATGNTDTARKLYLDNLASLSPEQRFASAQTVQTGKVMENARSIEAAHKKIHGGDSTRIKEGREDLQLGLDERKDLLLLQVEANELAQAGRLEKAEALLSGKMSLDGLDAEKLKASNPNAPRLTGENRKELSNETVVTQQREQLQTLINGNRSAMAQLEAQKQTLDTEIQKHEQARLGKSQGLMEKRTLLAVQQEKLARETQRLFQTHDKVTSFVNKGDLGSARDLIEGRKAVLDKNETAEKAQNAEQLAGREFVRNAEEETKYKETEAALNSLEAKQKEYGVLEGGVRTNLSLTKADIKKSNWIADWGGHTAGLETTALKEQARLGSFEQQKTKVAEAKSVADSLVKQGRYEEATALLGKAQQLASKKFIEGNEELGKAYGDINKDLGNFYKNLKDSSLTVVKNVAIGVVAASVAIALAPATGGMSLAFAGTMIGGGTLAGFALGTAIDVVDAGVDMAVFGDSAKTAFGDALGKAGSNLQTAGLGALGGGSGAVFTKLLAAKGAGALTSALSSAGGSSALSSGTTAFIERIKAEIDYAKLPEAEKAQKSKEDFMKERKVDRESIAKSLPIETLSGMGGGALGFKSAKAQLGATAARQAVIEATEKAVDMFIGLATEAALNDGKISPDGFAGALGNVATAGVIGRHTAEQIEARRMAATADSSVVVAADAEPSNTTTRVVDVPEPGRLEPNPKAKPISTQETSAPIKLPDDIAALPQVIRLKDQGSVTASINPNLPAGVNARTIVEIDPQTGKRNIKFEYANDDIAHGESPANRKIRLEEATHALERTIIDPIKPDGTKMSEQEYAARRVAQELLVRAGAEGKLSGSSSNPEQRKNSELYQQARKLIDAGDYEAARALGEANGFSKADWDNYQDNFRTNVNRDPKADPLRQVSNDSVAVSRENFQSYQQAIDDAKTLDQVKAIRDNLKQEGESNPIDGSTARKRLNEALKQKEQEITINERLKSTFGDNIPPELARIANTPDPSSPSYKADLELRRILLSTEQQGPDAILRDHLLHENKKVRELAKEIATEFSEIDRNDAITLLTKQNGPEKAVQANDVRNTLNSSGRNNMSFAAASRIRDSLEKFGLIDTQTNISKKTNAQIRELISDPYPATAISALSGKVKAKLKTNDATGPLHELRTQVALEQMIADGRIRSFIMAENVVHKTGDANKKGLDALGVDVLIQLNNGDFTVAQIKSSPTGVDGNYGEPVTYVDSDGVKHGIDQKTGADNRIARRYNYAIDASLQRLSDLQEILDPSRSGRQTARAIPSSTGGIAIIRSTHPDAERGQIVIDGRLFSDKNTNPQVKGVSGTQVDTLNKELMKILEEVVIK